jgi:hypothetical protein
MVDINGLARQFIEAFYEIFNPPTEPGIPSRRNEIAPFYTDQSLATFQNVELVGREAIMQFWLGENLEQMRKIPAHIMAQPSIGGTIVIIVQGELKTTPDEEMTLTFVEVIVLIPDESTGQYYIVNHIQSTHSV